MPASPSRKKRPAGTRRAESEPTRPFLKWAGGKFAIRERVIKKLPKGRRLIEPFVGSGAVFLNTDYDEYLLGDTNADLITLFTQLQQHGETFIEACRELFIPENNAQDRYYDLRDEFNHCHTPERRAVLFVYLNRHGYNGLCRYNRSGGFNAPFGRYARHPYFPEREMHRFAVKAARARFVCADFQETLRQARPGDVVYGDPPYVPLSASANFTAYSAGGFGKDKQFGLAIRARELAEQGVPVLLSNHDTEFTREVYAGAKIQKFKVRRSISCNGAKRGKANELLAIFEQTAHVEVVCR